jgi:hypothetical protein
LEGLNEAERNKSGSWKLDAGEMTSAVKFLGTDGKLAASTVTPEAVAKAVSVETGSHQASLAVG